MNAQILIFEVEQLSKIVAERMLQLRKAQGLTQHDVAAILEISDQSYGHYEKQIRKIPLDMIPSIAKALNSTEEELLGLDSKKSKRGPTSQLEKRFEQIKSLSKKEQQFMIEMIDRVLGNTHKKAS